MIDLRLGRWQDVLTDVEPDALIVDAPYSDRTHAGHDSCLGGVREGEPLDNRERQRRGLKPQRREINYAAWTSVDVHEFVLWWADRTRGWIVSITDHEFAEVWADELTAAGRYVFAPLPLVEVGSRVRLAGDGPSSWTCWIVVARPRALVSWGTLPGAYVYAGKGDRAVMGGKRTEAMRALVRDYSRPGQLVCDPCAGAGTTLIAADIEGRRAVGAECLAEHHAIAEARIKRGYTPSLFAE